MARYTIWLMKMIGNSCPKGPLLILMLYNCIITTQSIIYATLYSWSDEQVIYWTYHIQGIKKGAIEPKLLTNTPQILRLGRKSATMVFEQKPKIWATIPK